MKVEVIHTDESKKILLQVIEQLNEKDIIPKPGIYTVFFESTEPQEVPEFNR